MSNFKKLSAINIKDLIAKKGKHSYLSWASAWSLIKEEFPTTQRLVYENEHTGLNYFTDGTSAYVKVGITIDGLEHIDYLPIMDFRNQSIKIDKVTSMDVNTAIQRSTAKAIAMHGLGLSLWIGEDLTKSVSEPLAPTKAPAQAPLNVTLEIGDANWAKVLKYVAQNKTIGLPKIVKNLETKYSIKATVKKELSKHMS
jgi:hypothetical protein|tara:strand:- start:847 stop:1440 length:594 start_codon:yes stop_codon:yes gene_type:complete